MTGCVITISVKSTRFRLLRRRISVDFTVDRPGLQGIQLHELPYSDGILMYTLELTIYPYPMTVLWRPQSYSI